MRIFLTSLILFAQLAVANDAKEIAKVSEAFGHLIGKNIDTLGVEFDIELVVKGLKDATNGKHSPMSESECIEAIATVQENAFKQKSQANLANAESFLEKNGSCKYITSIEEGKIQYKIEKQGEGPLVEAHGNPVIRYTGTYLNGSVFGTSKKDEVISLDETILGFQKGLVGMKEGEKRTLYIHPDYGYGTQGCLPPNSLLTFEIEIIKANAPDEDLSDSLIIESDSGQKTPDVDAPQVR